MSEYSKEELDAIIEQSVELGRVLLPILEENQGSTVLLIVNEEDEQ